MLDHCIHLIFLKVQKKESSITRCLRLMVEAFLARPGIEPFYCFKNQLGERAKYGTARFIDPTKL